MLTVAGFTTIAVYTATREDAQMTIRVASVLMALLTGWRAWLEHRPGPAWLALSGAVARTPPEGVGDSVG
jgi:hypothetical protein